MMGNTRWSPTWSAIWVGVWALFTTATVPGSAAAQGINNQDLNKLFRQAQKQQKSKPEKPSGGINSQDLNKLYRSAQKNRKYNPDLTDDGSSNLDAGEGVDESDMEYNALLPEQEEKLQLVRKMFIKLYGLEKVPDEALAEVRGTVFEALNGVNVPKRERSDVVADNLIADVRGKMLSAIAAHAIIERSAELLGAETLSKEGLDGLLADVHLRFNTSTLTPERASREISDLTELVKSATLDEKKIEKRQLAREEKAKKIAEERQKKQDEEKKREERKAKAASRSNTTTTTTTATTTPKPKRPK